MADRWERLDWAERWFNDSFRVIDPAGGCGLLEVDMSRAQTLVARLRERGVPATYNHLVVRAAALALVRHPAIHLLVAGTRRLHPDRVDISLSVAGTTVYAPVMVLEDAGRKRLPELSREIVRRVPEVREKAEKDLVFLRRWGRLIPFGWLRRWILRLLFERVSFRRNLVGTFQVTCVNGLDVAQALLPTTAALLGVGKVRDRVVAVNGRAEVRPTLFLACAMDHKAWDGLRVATFQDEVRRILEEGQLDEEVEGGGADMVASPT